MLKTQKELIIEELAKDRGFWKQILKRVGWNESTAEDVLQKTLLKVYENLDRLRDINRLRPWVFQIMKNEALKTMYENKQKQFSFITKESYYEQNNGKELYQLLKKTLSIKTFYTQIEHKAATILIQEGANGISSKEISFAICQHLMCEMNYVTSLLYRIRNKLDIYLQQQGYESCLRKKKKVRADNAKSLTS